MEAQWGSIYYIADIAREPHSLSELARYFVEVKRCHNEGKNSWVASLETCGLKIVSRHLMFGTDFLERALSAFPTHISPGSVHHRLDVDRGVSDGCFNSRYRVARMEMVTRWVEARRDHQRGHYHKGGYGARYDRPLTPSHHPTRYGCGRLLL